MEWGVMGSARLISSKNIKDDSEQVREGSEGLSDDVLEAIHTISEGFAELADGSQPDVIETSPFHQRLDRDSVGNHEPYRPATDEIDSTSGGFQGSGLQNPRVTTAHMVYSEEENTMYSMAREKAEQIIDPNFKGDKMEAEMAMNKYLQDSGRDFDHLMEALDTSPNMTMVPDAEAGFYEGLRKFAETQDNKFSNRAAKEDFEGEKDFLQGKSDYYREKRDEYEEKKEQRQEELAVREVLQPEEARDYENQDPKYPLDKDENVDPKIKASAEQYEQAKTGDSQTQDGQLAAAEPSKLPGGNSGLQLG